MTEEFGQFLVSEVKHLESLLLVCLTPFIEKEFYLRKKARVDWITYAQHHSLNAGFFRQPNLNEEFWIWANELCLETSFASWFIHLYICLSWCQSSSKNIQNEYAHPYRKFPLLQNLIFFPPLLGHYKNFSRWMTKVFKPTGHLKCNVYYLTDKFIEAAK